MCEINSQRRKAGVSNKGKSRGKGNIAASPTLMGKGRSARQIGTSAVDEEGGELEPLRRRWRNLTTILIGFGRGKEAGWA